MSVFGTWLQGQLDAQGWDQRGAAKKIGVQESTIHNWIHQEIKPSVTNVLRVAKALRVPVEVVLSQAGYDVPHGAAVPSDDELARQRAAILAVLPQFAEVIDLLARKPPERQAAYIAVIRRILLDPSGRESNR